MTPRRAIPLLAALAAAALPAGAQAAVKELATPSRNIGCIGATLDGRTTLRCDIRETRAVAPPRPRNCPLEWGDAVEMTATGRPFWVCHGDTALPGPGRRVTPYGSTWRFGPFTCTVRVAGLTCRNRAGRGWFMSRERIRLFS
ncbi:MAG: hypothetical protein MUE51_05400 [Thermoleophilia bacterium]|jgi:hypothetical protein|nr:hypothetical protein [Thermoleophilia bacterium]